MWELILPLVGFLIGIIAALTGIGGGVFIVPLLTLFYSFLPANAAGTSLTTIVFTALAATLTYSRQKRVLYKIGLLLALVTVPGGVLGAYLTTQVPANLLGISFGFFLISFIALPMSINAYNIRKKLSMAFEADRVAGKSDVHSNFPQTVLLAASMSFLSGIASGLLGIGGGALLVPILTLIVGIPMHFATATSMFTITFSSSFGAAQHYLAGHTNLEYVLLLALGTVVGAHFGAHTSTRISSKNLRQIFSIVIFVVGLQMILKYI